MAFGNAILDMLGHRDPRSDLLRAAMGGATPNSGTGAPGTTPPGQPPVAQAYQSPPDLISLYESLQNRQNRASMINSGIGLIGASLAHPENRGAIMNMFGGQGGAGSGQGDIMSDIMSIYEAQQSQAASAAQQARASALASELGISLDMALYLSAEGELSDVIKDRIKHRPANTDVVTAADGSVILINTDTGAKIADILGPNSAPTSMQNEYRSYVAQEEAAGRVPMTQMEFDLARRQSGGQHINVNVGQDGNPYGPPPTNHVWARDAEGNIVMEEDPLNPGMMRPKALPVGPAAREVEQEHSAGLISADQVQSRTALMQDDIRRLANIVANNPVGTTGIVGSLTRNLPFGLDALNQDEVNYREVAKAVRANIGFEELRAMRASNPAGGALGQVSNIENELLQSVLGSLDNAQDAETLMYTLNRLSYVLDDYLAPALGRDTGRPRLGEVVDGYQYIGGDPNDERSWRMPR